MDAQVKEVPYRQNYPGFDNKPNPLEPHATNEEHPLDGTAKEPSKPTKQSFLRLLLDDDAGASNPRPAKRRKSGTTNSLDLPGLPVKKHGAQRLRIPPTLSGLHQPPPDAGLLPSMSTEQPLNLIDKPKATKAASPIPRPKTDNATNSPRKKGSAKSSRKHKKWSEAETADLLKGVARFGIGKWTLILKCPDFHFNSRTALDLKDRFRVCCPDDYREGRSVGSTKAAESSQSDAAESSNKNREQPRSKNSNRVSTAQLEKLGIDGPFEKSKRRQRTEWDAKEDEALLAAFKIHNNSWAAIRDSTPALKTRTTTDLRDRLRTRFPEEYAKAGLTPRTTISVRKGRRESLDETENAALSGDKEAPSGSAALRANDNPPWKEASQTTQGLSKKQPPATSILHASDVFWGAPFETDGSESEPITLDRGILDWPYDQRRADANSKGASIDPLATLNLPRPTATSSSNTTATSFLPGQQNLPNTPLASLPSVATITAVPDADSSLEHLELPSLVGAFGSLETDVRSGGHFMSMEELLS